MTAYRTIYTRDLSAAWIEELDAKRPAVALGEWRDVWERFPAESNASIPSEASAGKDALDEQKHPEPKEMK